MAAILIIEDNSDLRNLLVELLKTKSYDVQVAADGDEASEIYNRDKFDLILLDIFLPGKNGREILKELQTIQPQVPVIAMTGGNDTGVIDYMKMAQELGAVRVFKKPFALDAMLSEIDASLPH